MAAALLFAALLVGCGASTSAAQRFADRGNAICRETKRKSIALPPKTAGYVAKLGAIGLDGRRRLTALEPPPSLRAKRDRFFADLAALPRLAADPSKNRAKEIVLINRLPDEARALGWTDCAG